MSLRTSLLVPVLVAGSLLVAPAQAATPVTRTLSIAAAPGAALVSTSVTFSGKLTKSPKGSAVKVQRKSGSTWKLAKATATKTAAGAWKVSFPRPAKAGVYKYRAFAPKQGNLKAATSKTVSVTALRKTTFTKVGGYDWLAQAATEGSPSAALGHLNKPFTAGATARLQRKVGSSWTTVGTSAVDATGLFNIAYADPQTGQHRVVIARKGLNAAATSAVQTLTYPTP